MKIMLQRIGNMKSNSRLIMTPTAKVYRYTKKIIPRHMAALLWERSSRTMKNKIKARSDYIKIKNNPITLLVAIHQHNLNYQEI